MAKASPRAPLSGPAFIRLLARLTDAHVAQSNHALAARLSQWIDWTRAVAVSKALDGKLPEIDALPDTRRLDTEACARVRTGLATSSVVELDAVLARVRRDARSATAADIDAAAAAAAPALDYAPFRQHYLAMQRAMRTATGDLRGRLRDMLALESAPMARLAEVDAVMELTLSPREQTLLNRVPNLLGAHFERLRDAAQAQNPAPDGEAAPRARSDGWLDVFRKDMQSVLLAELDVRFHPIEGLLAALRTR
jgi:plasmid stability protein